MMMNHDAGLGDGRTVACDDDTNDENDDDECLKVGEGWELWQGVCW